MTLALFLIATALAAVLASTRARARAAATVAAEKLAAAEGRVTELGGVRKDRDRLRGLLEEATGQAVAALEAAETRVAQLQAELDDLRAQADHRELNRLIGATVVVHAKGQRIRGVLQGVYRDVLSLTDAEFVSSAGSQPFTGTVHVPRSSDPVVQQLPVAASDEIRQLGEEG